MDAVEDVSLLPAEHDHRRPRRPALELVDVAREDEVEAAVRRDEAEAFLRQVSLQVGLRRCEEQCCGHGDRR